MPKGGVVRSTVALPIHDGLMAAQKDQANPVSNLFEFSAHVVRFLGSISITPKFNPVDKEYKLKINLDLNRKKVLTASQCSTYHQNQLI